ncbi:MAG: DUF3137 domain-containing protein [Bacteroidales bacterium]|nr:DUF3137 domain-containing protein [Clostridium sp.]MCM1204153.1 DUF3137 domain-containing protein [Bacteroidales bacterium]
MGRYSDEELDSMFQEQAGKNRKAVLSIVTVIAVFLFCPLLLGILYIGFGSIVTIIGFFVLVYVMVVYIKKNFHRNMFSSTDILHDYLIPDCVQEMFGEDAVYRRKEGIPKEWISISHLIGKEWNLYQGKSLIRGTYRGIAFVQADVTLVDHSEYKDSEGNKQSHDVTVFKGPWAVLDFKKPFSTNLVVRERGEKIWDKWGDDKSTVDMEDVNFNKKFIVLAEDAHNAFYLLTPQMMEHILETEKRFKGRIYLCFMDGKIHIAIDNGKSSFDGIAMINGAANERKRIRERLSLVPELMKQMDI